jgi:excinuclease ABC subunit B
MNRVTAKVDKPLVGANLQAHLDGLRDQMRKAAENLEFEEAARLRDEVKRLEAVELAWPTTRWRGNRRSRRRGGRARRRAGGVRRGGRGSAGGM